MKRKPVMRFSRAIRMGMLILCTCLLATGCTLIRAKQDIDQGQDTTVIIGNIYGTFQGDGPIIVAACANINPVEIISYSVLHNAGEYELLLAQGSYYVFAYWDKNSNLTYDPGEPAAHYGNPDRVVAPAVGVVFDINITIPDGGAPVEIPHGTVIASAEPHNLYSRQAGIITDLDDERFAEENGYNGFWKPISFFKRFGGSIYFLEPYDPNKIPILFIHGAGGSPAGFKYLVDQIDRTRFQPWFFYYASGVRIDSTAYMLLWKLTNLQAQYQFNQIYITAYSMGGLVARSFIVNYNVVFPYTKLLISLATPWGGDRMAEYGVKQSPIVIPSWIDMQPDGDFIQSLYRKKLPETVTFYMFYGYRGSRNPFRSNNDGTITLTSILDDRPQSEAKMNYGFDEDHGTILTSKKVVDQYNEIINSFDEGDKNSPKKTGGFLRVRFSYDYEYGGRNAGRIFMLQPEFQEGKETVTHLYDDDNGKILGPFPAGEYKANLVTMAARTKKTSIPVSIENNQTKALNFRFIPDGVINGCVVAGLKQDDLFPGMPDYRYRQADTQIEIQSISLTGDGVHRVLQPVVGPETDDLNYLTLRNDLCYNTCFIFFGLPAGEYTLKLKARGFEPLKKKYVVTPGIPQYYRATELTPDDPLAGQVDGW
jgi:pimeloyl-ACP methyl ester carboxylesterase